MTMNKYRFDDAYGSVYELDEEAHAYIHIGPYLAYGIDSGMNEAKKIAIVEQEDNER